MSLLHLDSFLRENSRDAITDFFSRSGRMNLYNYTATSLPSTPTPTTTSATVPSATITDLPTGWAYKGCWVDRALGRGSILADNLPNDANMTVESCIQNCITAGYSIAGMEYYTQCYCDSAIINLGALASSDSQCNTPCGGNVNQMCGGGSYSQSCTLNFIPICSIAFPPCLIHLYRHFYNTIFDFFLSKTCVVNTDSLIH